MHPIRSGRFQHGAWSLSYEQHGEQGHPILLIHGLLLDTYVNRDIAQALAGAGYQVVLLDLLGHGHSDAPADATEYRIDFFADQALAAMDHLGWERATVGGVSLGTITALHMATRAPDRIRALLLEMPVMEHATPAAALMLTPVLLAARFGAPLYRPLAKLVDKLPRPGIHVWHSVINAAARDPAITSAILHGILVGPVVPPAAERRQIHAPTLVIGHEGDWLHPFDDAKALAGDLPEAVFLKAHSIVELRTRPKRLMPKILDFLARAHADARIPTSEAAAPAPDVPSPPSPPPAAEPDSLQVRFEQAVDQVRNAPPDGDFKPSNEFKLKMYALYRQATDGDVSGKRPGITNPVGRYKHDAWAAISGMSADEAMQADVDAVDEVARKHAS